MKYKADLKNILIILIVTLIGYWQIAFMQNVLKWDMLTQYFPFRFFISECYRNNLLPLWNPYEFLGYPICADPQSGAWYPFVLILGFLKGYNIFINNIEFILHIFIAGIGMYWLLKRFDFTTQIRLLLAICYLFCGLFVGNAQHLTYIITGAWLPFVIGAYIDLNNKLSPKSAIIAALFCYLLLTGGYPAFVIILIYLFLLLFIIKLIELIKERNKNKIIKLFLLNFVFVVFLILFSAAYIYSFINFRNDFSRSEGVSVENALFGPFSPRSAISFLMPFPTVMNQNYFDTDISMANAYFGILIFILFIYSFFRKKSKTEIVFLGIGIFCLAASMGKYLYVRQFLYDYVPLMNLFRFPSIFRIFFIICFIICAGYTLQSIEKNFNKKKLYIFSGIALLAILAIIIPLFKSVNWKIILWVKNFFDLSNILSFNEHFIVQGILQGLIILIFLLIIYKTKNFIHFIKYLTLLLVFEMIISTQLNAPITIYSNFKPKSISDKLKRLPKSFPIPPKIKLINTIDKSIAGTPLQGNSNMFFKNISFDGNNPFVLNMFGKLNNSKIRKNIFENEWIYLSCNLVLLDSLNETTITDTTNSKIIYAEKSKFQQIEGIQNMTSSSNDIVDVRKFNPNNIKVFVNTESPQVLTLMQNNCKGWSVYIDNKKTQHFTSNYAMISVIVPSGKHNIEYVFSVKYLNIAVLVSIFSIIFSILFLVIPTKFYRKKADTSIIH